VEASPPQTKKKIFIKGDMRKLINRKNIANLIKKLPFSSEYIGPPKGYKILEEYINNINSYKNTYTSQPLENLDYETLENRKLFKLKKKCMNYTHFVVELEDVRVCREYGGIINKYDEFLTGKSLAQDEPFDCQDIFKTWKFPAMSKQKGIIANLGYCDTNGYFHWLIDVLPRLDLIEKSGLKPEKYLINYNSNIKFQKETLDLLGINQDQIINMNRKTHLKCEKVILPSLSGGIGYITEQKIQFLREKFLKQKNNSLLTTPKRIYISREKAPKRKILNEKDFLPFIENKGFKKIYLEDFSFSEQVQLFNQAEVIISPHGAGLTNLIFCNSETKVLELFPYCEELEPCYAIISKLLSLSYYYLQEEKNFDDKDFNVNQKVTYKDFNVNQNQLEKILELMMI